MNDKTKIEISIVILIVGFAAYYVLNYSDYVKKSSDSQQDVNAPKEIPVEGSLFKVLVKPSNLQIDQSTKTVKYKNADLKLDDNFADVYKRVNNNKTQNVVVVYPTFTDTAYSDKGFYDYYKKHCDASCLNIPINYEFTGDYSASRTGFNVLRLLGYDHITDVDIDKNPEILKKYDKVILLHSEYTTKKEFDAIINHPKVIYLYPNSLYAEINSDYNTNKITLVRGHNYPQQEIRNGFDWELDNSNLEYDNACTTWSFYKVKNGIMLNCYPEFVIFKNESMLRMIKDY